MVVFPGSIRWAIDGLLTDLSGAPGVSAIGLYGSWVRGDATDSSDLDLLVVDGSGVDYEWSETRDMEGFLVDLNHVPGVWVREPVNPVVDHKLHEAVVLHDPEVVLGSARGFVERNFRSPGRIEVRTDGFIAMSEMYLSRASGAVNRGDVETAAVYVGLGLVPAGYALMDVAGVPVTRRGFVWNLRRACMLMGVDEFYGGFISSCRLGRLGRSRVEGAVDGFRGAWEGVSRFMVENRRVLRGLHGKLRRDLAYLTDERVLEGVLARVREMLGVYNLAGCVMYLRWWLLPLLEGYAWAFSSVQGERFDYTSLFRSLSEAGGGVYDGALGVFGVGGSRESVVRGALAGARELVGNVRLDRRRLIEDYLV